MSDLAVLMNYPALKLPILGLMNGGEIIHFLYCSSQQSGSFLFLAAEGILTNEERA